MNPVPAAVVAQKDRGSALRMPADCVQQGQRDGSTAGGGEPPLPAWDADAAGCCEPGLILFVMESGLSKQTIVVKLGLMLVTTTAIITPDYWQFHTETKVRHARRSATLLA